MFIVQRVTHHPKGSAIHSRRHANTLQAAQQIAARWREDHPEFFVYVAEYHSNCAQSAAGPDRMAHGRHAK